MELQEGDYILGFWFASDYNLDCCYGIVKKTNEKWIIQQTFRYNKENKEEFDPFSGKDKKNIYYYEASLNKSEKSIIESMNEVFDAIKIKYRNESDMFFVRGDASKFIDIAKTKHYLHLKEIKNDMKNLIKGNKKCKKKNILN